MANLKRQATIEETATVECPVTSGELSSRQTDYLLLSPVQFAKKYRNVLFRPVRLNLDGRAFDIQVNACTNPFCKWFGRPQERFETVKHKPYRYKLVGSDKSESKSIVCNPDPTGSTIGMTWNCYSGPLSNWSVAEEITRLATLDKVTDWTPEYEFHRETCPTANETPFSNPKAFYKQGKSKSNAQRWQCKTCKKFTHVLPKQRESFSYHQKRNDILPRFADLLIARTPVKRICETLKIGSETYYNKLEWLYQKCLEFLERHETKALANHQFDTLWVDTDQLVYYLNYIKRHGQGGRGFREREQQMFETHVLISCDVILRYVFRADLAYDWNVDLDAIQQDTLAYKDDHLNLFARKNGRLRNPFTFCPQPPTEYNGQTQAEYELAIRSFWNRARYTDGVHVNQTYTAIAHYWLLKQLLSAKEWRFISDEDGSIMYSLYRVFAPEIRRAEAHHFLCKLERGKSSEQAYAEYKEGWKDLRYYARAMGMDLKSPYAAARSLMEAKFHTHSFHEEVVIGGKTYRKKAKRPIRHPLPTRDRGFYEVDCATDLSAYSPDEIAEMVLQVNNHATNAFMQQIRRRLSILERPLVTASGEGKSYIYANFNPKYARHVITILRTYHNFCKPIKSGDEFVTPAQRLGITDKQFDMKDIIYFS
ncbi:insertion element protein [Alicyclobacillus fastidiosus]|uniref:Insertion element protein n=1 Tax=Alicyclobacillus fastidiosus TaxID=392011 RepID=A0ABY6ZPF7_9BACL|nr:insertion element protein [Alicyclobacillus fastidiosus]WAH44031.1 insertion element protein [Alicyclobacillus fastidiosus]GMA60319.1 hypothetical protein GCM10025859_07590 [Alicyclobacillus fastidiosus]